MRSHPFADLLGLVLVEQRPGYSRWRMTVAERHLNPHQVVHGGAIYALATSSVAQRSPAASVG